MAEPPLSEQRLIGRAETIVEGRVVSLRLEAVEEPPHAADVYRASLLVESVLKGELSPRSALDIVFERIPPGQPLVVGFTEVPFLPGERVRAYLRWDPGKRAWRTFHWMGKVTLEESRTELPRQIGERISIDRTGTPPGQSGGTSTP